MLECAIATGFPSGVTTMSISSWTRDRLFSRTIIANTEVPAETLPERGRTALVATMPVPASPSGGHSGMPAGSLPEGSISFAPSAVSFPAGPAGGQHVGEDVPELPAKLARRDQAHRTWPSARRPSRRVSGSMGNIPDASPTPILCSPVSFQWT